MACEHLSHADLAAALDIAEYLPRLIADTSDRTIEFRDSLADLAGRWREFGVAVEHFDGSSAFW